MIVHARLVGLLALAVLAAAVLVPMNPPAGRAPTPFALRTLGGPHAPIVITSDAGFNATNGVTGGSGTSADPYIISDWSIDASLGTGIAISGTTAYFLIEGVVVHGFPAAPSTYQAAITLQTRHGTVNGSQVQSGSEGIFLAGDDLHVRNTTIRAVTYGVFAAATNASVVGSAIGISPRQNWYRDGVRAFWGKNVTVAGNVLMGGGIEYICTDRGRVEANAINGTWIQMESSRGVTILHNNLLDAVPWDIDYWDDHGMSCGWPRGNNTWDGGYPVGGNYYSWYTGADVCSGADQDLCTGGDGIGDTPAPISTAAPVPAGNFTDRYPLMRPWLGPPAVAVSYALFGNATRGWGYSNATIAKPGPHLFGLAGVPCTLTLVANDTQTHAWFLDLNGDGVPEAGEPQSEVFNAPLPLSFTFTVPVAGNFTYRDAFFPSAMMGPFTALPGAAPYAALTVTPSLANLTTVFTADASGSRNETGGTGGLAYRWDWDGNGTWDTDWQADAVATHAYSVGGWYLVRLEVRSAYGGTDVAMDWASVDDMAPITDIWVDSQPLSGGWYRIPPVVSLDVHDAFLDNYMPVYRVDGGGWKGYMAPFTLATDGNHSIEYQTSDFTGHVEPVKEATVKVDAHGPDLVAHFPTGSVLAGNVTFTWAAGDAVSGVAGYRVAVDGANPVDLGLATRMTLPLSPGAHTFLIIATDGAGNERTATGSVTVVAAAAPSEPGLAWELPALVGIVALAACAALVWVRVRRRPPDNP